MEQTYKIGEAATLLNLKTYVLRFWETEFPQIAPLRTEKGQRLYRAKDIELLERIRYLLHEQGLTIDGARKILDSHEAEAFIPTSPIAANMPSPMEPHKHSPDHAASWPPHHSAPSPKALPSDTTQAYSPGSPGSPDAPDSPDSLSSPDSPSSPCIPDARGTSDKRTTGEAWHGTPQGTQPVSLKSGVLGHAPQNSPESDSGFSHAPLAPLGQPKANQTDGQVANHTASTASASSESLRPSGAALQTLITDLEEVATILRCDATQGSFIQ